jgi:hypothetical protein
MSVHRNWDNRKAGGVLQNAHPQVHPFAWQPTQRNVRANPNIPSQPQRIQPHERGTFFPTSATAGGTLAPQMSSGGCAGCGGCNGSAAVDAPPTASELATSHNLPSKQETTSMRPVPVKRVAANGQTTAIRPQPRSVGALRAMPRPAGATFKTAGGMLRPTMMTGRGSKL